MNNDWLDIAVLEDYLDGKLDAKTMNRVEREALEDPFVAEALAGLSASPKRSLASISLLQKQLQERIAEHQVEKKTKVITWQRLSIAATAAVLFIAVSVIFWMKEVAQQNQLAKQGKAVEVNLNAVSGTVVPEDQSALAKNKPEISGNAQGAAGMASAAAQSDAGATADALRKEKVMAEAAQTAKRNSYAANSQKKANAARNKEALSAAQASDAVSSNAMASDVMASEVMSNRVAAAPNAYASPMAKSMRKMAVSAPMLQGKVVSDVDGQPLAGVAVQVVPQTKGIIAVTGINGEFSIPADSLGKIYTIGLTHPGFDSEQVVARLNEPLDIILKKQQGIAAVTKPLMGWVKYEQYLQENNQLTKESSLGASLEISFGIGKDGRPYDFKILRTFGAKYEKEAIRLVSEGPKWEVPADPKARVKLSVKF